MSRVVGARRPSRIPLPQTGQGNVTERAHGDRCGRTARIRYVRMLALIGVSAALIGGALPTASARPGAVRGPFLLVALPALGTVTWRCTADRPPDMTHGPHALGLGFSAFRASATARIRLRVGGRVRMSKTVDPGESVRFPLLQARIQRLELVQFTGAGTLRASVTVDLVPPGTGWCYSYLPPKTTVRVQPRQ